MSKSNFEKSIETSCIVSSTEPTGLDRKKVWFKKGKNLFNYLESVYLNAFISTSTNKITTSTTTTNHQTSYIKCEPNKTYTISKEAGHSFRIGTSTLVPAIGVAINQTMANHTGTKLTITTGANDNYLVFTCFSTVDGDTGNYLEMYTTVQVEAGTAKTDYEAYVQPAIYTLNSNNDYEKFKTDELDVYSKIETKTNKKWVDGKPFYRTTIILPNGTGVATAAGADYSLSNYGIANVEKIFLAYPSMYSLEGNYFPFNFYDGNKFEAKVNSTTLHVTTQFSGIANSEMIFTLEYTKTTD